jgi:LacI family transcriptional regulator
MAESGLEVPDALVRVGRAFTEPEGARMCDELLDTGEPFTAIVAANDLLALGCYDVFARRGLACPRDVSVVGFNDMPFADRFSPPLSTIRIPHYEIGAAAAELLLEHLADPAAPVRQIVLPPSLVRRGSSGRPPDRPVVA